MGVGDSKFSTLAKLSDSAGYSPDEDCITFGIRLRLEVRAVWPFR